MPRKKVIDVATQMERLVRARFCEEPLWLRSVQEVPPPTVEPKGDKTYNRLFPKSKLAGHYWNDVQNEQGYLSEKKLATLGGASSSTKDVPPQIAFEFANEQIVLMEQGMEQEKAFETVKKRFTEFRSRDVLESFNDQKKISMDKQCVGTSSDEFFLKAAEAFKTAMKAELEEAKQKFEKLRRRANEKRTD